MSTEEVALQTIPCCGSPVALLGSLCTYMHLCSVFRVGTRPCCPLQHLVFDWGGRGNWVMIRYVLISFPAPLTLTSGSERGREKGRRKSGKKRMREGECVGEVDVSVNVCSCVFVCQHSRNHVESLVVCIAQRY